MFRKQNFHLLVVSNELKERKRNPLGAPGPTPEQQKEAWQKELAERARKAREQEERGELCRKKRKADEAFAMELHIALKQRNDEERIRSLKWNSNQPNSEKEKVWRKKCVERARALAMAQGRIKQLLLTFLRFFAKVPAVQHREQRQVHRTRHCRLHLLSPAEMARREWLRQHFHAQDRHAGHADHARHDDGSHAQDCSGGSHHPRKGRPKDPYCT